MFRNRIQTSEGSSAQFVVQQQQCVLSTNDIDWQHHGLTEILSQHFNNYKSSSSIQQLESLCKCYSHEISSRYSCRFTVRFDIFSIWFLFFGPVLKKPSGNPSDLICFFPFNQNFSHRRRSRGRGGDRPSNKNTGWTVFLPSPKIRQTTRKSTSMYRFVCKIKKKFPGATDAHCEEGTPLPHPSPRRVAGGHRLPPPAKKSIWIEPLTFPSIQYDLC